MHIPDGFINLPTSAGFGAVSAGGIWYSLRQAAHHLDDRRVPLAGLVAAFVFAAQMVNFPVVSGTSGHLLGGVLAAVLVGPWLGALVLTVVLVVQGVFFADGGLSALGLNVFNMAIVGALGGYLLYRGLIAVLPKTRPATAAAAGVAGGLSVVLASLAFVLEYAIGGEGGAGVGTVAAAVVGVHALIGIGVGFDHRPGRRGRPRHPAGPGGGGSPRGGVDPWISDSGGSWESVAGGPPGGRGAQRLCLRLTRWPGEGLHRPGVRPSGSRQRRGRLPVANYTVDGVDNGRLSTALAGIIGVTITLAVSAALFYGIRLYGKARGARKPPGHESHVHSLYRHTEGVCAVSGPEVKLAATLLFVVAVVATPREAFWAFGAHAALVVAAAAAGRLPPRFLLRRLLVEAPFLLFAVFLPFIGSGERVRVIGLSLSHAGLWAAWNILAKATLGAAASVAILAATTRVPDLLKAFSRLRFPRVLTAMMGFMVRYLDVVADDLGRMRIAQQSRAYRPRWARPGPSAHWPAPCSSARTRGASVAVQTRGYGG